MTTARGTPACDTFVARQISYGSGDTVTLLSKDGVTYSFYGQMRSKVSGVFRLCYVEIEEKTPGAAIDWEQWAVQFVGSPHFVQAWIADAEYDKWENAQDPLIYKAANRDYSSLPKRSNGLPPPVAQMVVDISQNPGRWEFRSGYIEAVGFVMWLSGLFWRYVGVYHKERLAGFVQANIKQVAEDVVRISISETSFTDQSTRDLQDRLRNVLYR